MPVVAMGNRTLHDGDEIQCMFNDKINRGGMSAHTFTRLNTRTHMCVCESVV